MKPRTKFLIGGALVLGVAGYLMARSIKRDRRVLSHADRAARQDARPIRRSRTRASRSARASCRARSSAIPAASEYAFRVTDGSQTFPVVYRGIAPDTFTDSVDVVVGGRMGTDGTFQATELLAKCASRYENAPATSTSRRRATRPRQPVARDPDRRAVAVGRAADGGVVDDRVVRRRRVAPRRPDGQRRARTLRDVRDGRARVDRSLDRAAHARLLARVRREPHQREDAELYVFTAFWSGQAGSMLFWALILSMYATIAIATSRGRATAS